MGQKHHDTGRSYTARIPSDVDTPDKIVYGLTARQLAILAAAAALVYGMYRAVGRTWPLAVQVAAAVPIVGVAIVLALGRRDGLSLDRWLLAGIRAVRSPKHLVPAADSGLPELPAWAPPTAKQPPLSLLQLPAQAIADTGVVDAGDRLVALVACSTVNVGLRTSGEQAALVAGYARWLNSLSGPVQVVVSTQRVDLPGHAARVAEAAQHMTNPALADAARDYAEFLEAVAQGRDPLCRTVTVAVIADGPAAATEVLRRADHTAAALSALGTRTSVLDGPRVTALLAATVDPYSPSDASWPRTSPTVPITRGAS